MPYPNKSMEAISGSICAREACPACWLSKVCIDDLGRYALMYDVLLRRGIIFLCQQLQCVGTTSTFVGKWHVMVMSVR